MNYMKINTKEGEMWVNADLVVAIHQRKENGEIYASLETPDGLLIQSMEEYHNLLINWGLEEDW